ncbi:SDR family oxidoreductase [Mucilaginibacter sp. Bleaf8]|uniref:SDR family NAD(P)-dependent oxidoreductase n=1 Tax=Mucilaginibacter sp. Bleaf8 TaxID=2834430 RepID=UPI001BD0EE9F|nr:SDR family oxidoreductase [Mucilaginibacter sp. Bleaf8]MBS7566496.1 SDR family oxidoreductase [Mucilaginibacter sp. Bleaf8]
MNLNIKEKVAVITGGDSGIGLATAKLLAAEGAHIVLTDIRQDTVDKAAAELQSQAPNIKVLPIACNLDDNTSVLALAAKVDAELGGANILINCAGARGAAGDFLSLTDEDWLQTINTDLLGAVRVCRAFIPQLQKKGWGRVVLVSSENAYQPYEEESPYNACKAGIINLSKCLSRSYSKDGLLFNCVSPAYVESPMTNAMMDELAQERGTNRDEAVAWFLKNKRPHIAVGRRGQPEEVAAVIAFLSSDLASYVNGSNYRVDGGAVESAF